MKLPKVTTYSEIKLSVFIAEDGELFGNVLFHLAPKTAKRITTEAPMISAE
ncbi:MAG: hypothetical protein IPH37_12625 [Burkholderiales bacterium]|nr:hypothetical protein [Burkholderiales bacterium]